MNIVEQLRSDRDCSGNDRPFVLINVDNLSDLVKHIKTSNESLVFVYNGDDYEETVAYWNNNVKTNKSIILLTDKMNCVNPTEFVFYKVHRLLRSESDAISSMPKLSQCDPVCRWLGFEQGDVIDVEGTIYQVYDEKDKYFLDDYVIL